MITSSAIRQGELIFSMPSPARHHDIIHATALQGLPIPIRGQQGFLDNASVFCNREVAGKIAVEDEQISQLRWPPELFSEDLW